MQKSNFNLSIHGLRGFAALSVVLFHVHGMGAKNNSLWPSIEWLLPIGPFFVCIFFCISGFLIAQTLEKHNSLRIFAKNRLVRIYPVFLILHLLMFTFGPAKGYDWMANLSYISSEYFKAFIANLLFLPGIFDLPIAQKNAWSLSYEALFYILAGIVWRTSTISNKTAKTVYLSIEFALIIIVIYTWNKMSFFTIGIGCYLLQKHLKQLPSTHQMGLVSLVIAIILYGYQPLAAFPFLCVFFFEVVQEQGLSAQILRLPLMSFLGTISYSLYLIHPFVMDVVRSIAVKIAKEGNPSIGNLTLIVVGPCLSIIIAWASYELIEKRLTKLFN